MGRLVTTTIANLISGVSQQPWNVRLPTQAEEQINCYSSVTDFLKRRPATRHLAELPAPEGDAAAGVAAHVINRDEDEKYIALFSTGGIIVRDLDGNPKSVTIQDGAAAYLAQAVNAERDLRFLTINDYTFVLNRRVTVRKKEDSLSPKRQPEALVFIKQASYNTTYNVTVDGKTASFTTLDGVAPADQPADKLSSSEIAQSLGNQITAFGGYTVGYSNATLWIRKADGTDFKVKVEDTRSNTHMVVCKGQSQRFSDLPTVAPRGYVVEVIGDQSSSFDNYYCVFEPTDEQDDFGEGYWKETVAPGIPCELDPASMPHALIRQADGTFSFGPLEWAKRECGDEDSAPFPSFLDRTLGGIFFYRNRLAFLAGENVIMSEVGEFFNFFLTTVTTLVDSDVIDVAASHVKSNILEHAAVFSGGLLLFSEQSQFVLEHDTVLSNATVSVKPVTEFEASMTAQPVSAGKTVFFASGSGEWAGVREYFTMPDSTDQNDAADVTAHVPQYIPGAIRRLSCSTNEDILLVLSDMKRDSIWIYKYFWNGNEKVQSAWSRWDMAGEVLAAVFVNADCYLVMRYATDGPLFLETLSVAPGHRDVGEEFEYALDRKITETACAVEVSQGARPSERTTSVTLPYALPQNMEPLFVTRTAQGQSAGRVLDVLSHGADGRTFTLRGDLSGVSFFAGLSYTSSYIFTTFALREDNGKGNAVMEGRLQLRSLTLNCARTGYLEIHVRPQFRNESTYTFTGRELGHGSNIIGAIPLYTGSIKAPLLSHNTWIQVEARSASFLPFSLVNASVEGFYNSRSQRM